MDNQDVTPTVPKYERKFLFADEECQIIRITLKPGDETPIHDHGSSRGTILVLKGEISERTYDPVFCEWSPWITHCAESIVREEPGGIHVMANHSAQDVVTLHVYAPPLQMKFYDPKDVSYPFEPKQDS